jgi:hypothetical protein
MDIDEHSPDAVMHVIPLPDEDQLQPQDQNSTADKNQLQLREMEMQQMEIEAQHNQPLQDQLIDQGNMPQQAIELQSPQEIRGDSPGLQR